MKNNKILIMALALLSVIVLGNGMALAAYAPPPTIPTCGTPQAVGAPVCTDFFGVANYANSPVPAGPVQTITVIDKGSHYSIPPAVTITDLYNPNASGASAAAILDGDGHVVGVTVTNGGSGYMAPQVSIDPPTVQGATATAQATIGGLLSGGIRKFVNGLPGLTAAGANNLGQYIPLANPDTAAFPGSDYFVIGLKDHTEQMNADLTPTKIRGYYQVNSGTAGPTDNSARYLGPLILATKNRPSRILFQNELPTGSAGDLFIPTDATYMGAGATPTPGDFYTQNRATLHLHGGNTPWISDGTPHQWITPPGETGTGALKGDSFQNVPDMVGPGKPITTPTSSDGLGTFFWSNQQGERLMFYHDHAYGMTRLNVYAGEAAGYYLVDPLQEQALATATAPGTIITDPASGSITSADLAHLIPLVIQDKTFVPSQDQLNATDPTWNSALYGGAGNFWFPHVYMTNQDPNDPLNMNAFGRWDYGPWFVPPQTSLTAGPITIDCTSSAHAGTIQCPIIPNPSGTPESFMDTPVINGTAYPVLHVAPEAYRFQILSAGNDRQLDLSWFVAADANGTVCNGTQPQGTACTEVNMLPAVTPTNMPLCSDVTAITNPALQTGLAMATLDAAGNPINGTGLPAGCWPSTWPVTNGLFSAGLSGIVPDPRNAGPPWIQIGTEGGLLPAPVVIPATPTTFETNPKSVTVGSMAIHGLFLGPAERADVIVDFSRFAGKTLILYNDGPTPDPGYDVRYDYFTGNADSTSVGGAPTTQPGYGPNLRTIMQVIVDQPAAAKAPFTLSALNTVFVSGTVANNLFVRTQPTPVIPEPSYNSVYNKSYSQTYSKIEDNYLSYLNFDGTVPKVTVTAGGSNYDIAPTVVFTGGGCTTQPVAVATITGGTVTDITLTNPGGGCTSAPAVTLTPVNLGSGATALVGSFMERKAIQELFTLDYGRLNATLGTELPFTNFLTQTTIPLGYIDPPTELFKNGETQLWRVTHNGVDTHLMHFHLFNVQVINRVGWDGTVRPPDSNELGWKDTVRMNPLEDAIVAIMPMKQTLPFLIQDSVRLLDVTQPASTTTQFTGVDPFTNLPMTVTNQPVNFGWEYVWHCHILGHEENDMMRPMVFQVTPEMPTGLNAVGVSLSWTNNSASTTSFTIQQASNNAFTTGLTTINYTVNGNPPAMDGQAFNPGPITYPNNANGPFYRVAATKTFPARQSPVWTIPPNTEDVSSAWAYISGSGAGPAAGVLPASLTFNPQLVSSSSAAQQVTLSNTGTVPLTINGISFTGANPDDFTQANNCLGTVAAGGSCTINVSFIPTASGARSASLSLASNDPASPLTLAVSGNGIAPIAGINPTSFLVNNGANVLLNVGSFPMTFTLSNTGNAPLVINSIAVGGADPGDFPITANTCVSPLAAAANCSITVTFTAKAIGARSASLNIINASPANSIAVPMNATVVAPIAAVSPASLTFVPLLLNATSAGQAVTLSNTGNASLNISGIALAGANPGDYAITSNTCVSPLVAGANCAITVTFTPIATGLRSATLEVTDDSGNVAATKQTVPLSGTGISPDAVLAPPQPGPLVFPILMLNTVSPPQTVTLANTGTAELTIAGIAITGDFSQTNNCPSIVAAGGSCTINVSFTPTATGARTGKLTITDNTNGVPGSFQYLDLNGTGTDFLVGTSSLVFSNQLVGTTSAVNSVTLSNSQSTPITNIAFTMDGTNPADFIKTTSCRATLGAGRSCTVSLRFKPKALGSRTAFLNITSSDPAGTQRVFLTGNGVSPVNNVLPATLTFDSSLKAVTAPQVVTVNNSGTAPMTIRSIAPAGTNANQFARTTTCGKTLAPGASCTVSVTFKPTTATPTPKSASLNVKAAAPATTQSVSLTGNVVTPAFTVSTTVPFADQTRNTRSAPQTVTVTNTGTVPMTFTSVKLVGTNANQFAQTNTCTGAPLAAGANCTINVTFRPTTIGAKTATLNVRPVVGATQSVGLSGTGI